MLVCEVRVLSLVCVSASVIGDGKRAGVRGGEGARLHLAGQSNGCAPPFSCT